MVQRGRKPEDFQFSAKRARTEEKAQKSWFSQLMSPVVAVVAVATMMCASVVFILVSELNDRVVASSEVIRDLEVRTQILQAERAEIEEILRSQLSTQSAENAEQLREYEDTVSRLQSQIDQLSQELREVIAANPGSPDVQEIDEQIGESRNDLERLSNAVFFVSIRHNGIPLDSLDRVGEALFQDMGFNEQSIEEMRFPSRNVVFYYEDFSIQKANEIAEVLSDLLGTQFSVTEGRGSGISLEERRTAIVVHIRL